MKKIYYRLIFSVGCLFLSLSATANVNLQFEQLKEIERRARALREDIDKLKVEKAAEENRSTKHADDDYATMPLTVHTRLRDENESLPFMCNPSALLAGDKVVTFIAGMPVVTAQYLGERPAFDGSDLIVNISSINQDVRLMMRRDMLHRALRRLGYPEPNSPIIALSGAVAPGFIIEKPWVGRHDWDIDLNTAELDAAIGMNNWVEGYLSFSFDPSPPASGGQRVANSEVALSKGFVNVGNNDRTPFYMTAGQIYVPFGRYSTAMVSNPLILAMARTLQRAVIGGFMHQQDSGFYGATYLFRSDTRLNGRTAGGLNLGYDFSNKVGVGDVGFSLTNSINESAGMQGASNLSGQFAGFGAADTTEVVRKIPALDVHGSINIDAVSFTAEWVGATQRFRFGDLSYNNRGAKPQALHTEASYTFKVYDKPATVTAAYGWTKDALALGIPRQRYSAILNISLWRDTVESLEFRHEVDYPSTSQGSGIGATNSVVGTGRHANAITGQLAIYF